VQKVFATFEKVVFILFYKHSFTRVTLMILNIDERRKYNKKEISIVRKYNVKKTISMKQFISEFGENFSKHMKQRLLELEVRCVLTRKDNYYRLDLKHVEHTKYNCHHTETNNNKDSQKEFSYGQFVINDGNLYFSEQCLECADVMQSPVVDVIYNSLNNEGSFFDSGISAKKVDDDNIDHIIDHILGVCPEVSKEYISIISRYRSIDKQ
jgi:hypothetical protein